MSKIRVLIVDDAVVIRRIVSDVLAGEPGIEIVGTAANGRIALQKIPQTNPDLITLDVEMPEMDGLATLKELRKTYRKLPVIMFSTLTGRGASTTLDALANGASDYVTKPANVGSVSAAMTRIREELIPKIKALCPQTAPTPPATMPVLSAPRATVMRPTAVRSGGIEAVVIGVSTGGPNALAEVIPSLPRDLPVPVLIVQHMPPVFTRVLAERLALKSAVAVKEAVHGEAIRPGTVYIAPGDFHMHVERAAGVCRVMLSQGPPENSCRPAADVLMRTAAAVYGANTLGVILTGMGQDGLRGAEAIRDRGGVTFVQDEASSVVWGMPGHVARNGLADRQVPLGQVAMEITRRVNESRTPARVVA
ncbi:MAG TPA: chemotaxis response regulator protein-glutamate methylesterase [Tepidisphaeraceae bacterium]|jgi:two-component system chemotaxis response regulator CheB